MKSQIASSQNTTNKVKIKETGPGQMTTGAMGIGEVILEKWALEKYFWRNGYLRSEFAETGI